MEAHAGGRKLWSTAYREKLREPHGTDLVSARPFDIDFARISPYLIKNALR